MRLPPVSTLRPMPLPWRGSDESTDLLRPLGLNSSNIQLAAVESSVKYFRVSSPEHDLFIKLAPPVLARRMMRGERLAAALKSRGCRVISVIREVQRVRDGSFAFVYEYVQAPYLRVDRENVDVFAESLARLHSALAMEHDVRFARRSTRMIRRAARAAAEELITVPLQDEQITSDLHEFLQADLAITMTGAQHIHNDLHAANVFMDRFGQPSFFDFEEMSWSYFPVSFDVAKAVERFILADRELGRSGMEELTRRFLTAYCAVTGKTISGADLVTSLRWHLGFAWVCLRTLLREGAMAHPEVEKFKQLSAILECESGWLGQVEVPHL